MSNYQRDILKANILVVDDTPANLRLLAGILTGAGYIVRPARNGRMALASAQTDPPDLILLDVMMPDMNGYQVCQQLKTDECTRDIPVIFVSAMSEVLDKVTAFSVGGVDYITKPFQQKEVLSRVMTHLTIRDLQKKLQEQNEQLKKKNSELQEALVKVKLLSGLLPICANCKKIRDDEGYWKDVTVYVQDHSEAEFSHGICPQCAKKLYPEFDVDDM